jgi:formate dehydrogenase major subunit
MMTVDGKPAPAQGTLLEACRAAGVELPAFCHDPRLSAGGHCRACLVELDGHPVAACVTAARARASVRTDTRRLRAYRRDLGELMLSESSPRGEVAAVLRSWGVDGRRYGAAPGRAPDRSHPFVHLEPGRCILCRRCIRACEEIQGCFVFGVTGRGADARLAWGGGSFAGSPCVACGACVTACPTGALDDVDRQGSASRSTTTVRTTCGYCGVGCQVDVHVADGKLARVEGAPSPVNRGHLCVKGRYAHAWVADPERLTVPLIRRDGRLVEADWDSALDLLARETRRLAGRVAALSSARGTNEENYLLQKWFRAGLLTNDVDCCARVCHAPSAAGMRAAFGAGAATNAFDDVERADLLVVVGANPTEAHPVLGARIRQAALRGARLVVVDPRRTELAEIADLHLRPRPGTNVPLLNAMACALVEQGLVNADFVARRVEGWEAFAPFALGQRPADAERLTGVRAADIVAAATLYGRAARPMILHGLGVTEHYQGSEAVMLLCNLALLAGAVGRPGTGVNPLRGQNNVQGAADMGCQPDLLPGYQPVDDPAVRRRFEAAWGRPLPTRPGRTLPRMIEAVEAGELRGLFVVGEDPAQTDPDSRRVRGALASLELLVVQELFLSRTASLAHVVLPAAAALEKDGTFTNGERRIQRVRRALAPPGGARPDWEILCDLMARTGYPQPYRHPAEIWDEIALLAPIFAGVSYGRLDGDGLQWPVPDHAHPGTPVLHVETFGRGRGRLHQVEFAPSPGSGAGLLLTTGRVLEHYNSGSMTRRTAARVLAPEDRLEIHPDDARARGVRDGDPVLVTSARGEARARARVTRRVPPGTAFLSFHDPDTEANALTGGVRDRITDCPEYKLTAVEVRPAR